MYLLAFFIFSLMAVAGCYLIGMAAYWRFFSYPVTGEVIGFQSKKKKGHPLPLVAFEDQDGNALKGRVERSDHVGFLIFGAHEGDIVPMRYHKHHVKRVQINGFLNFILGGAFMVPLVFFLLFQYASVFAQSQFMFALVFFAVFGGGWLVLRCIRENY